MQDLDADELIADWTRARADIALHEIGTEEHERALMRAIACSEEYRRRLVNRRSSTPRDRAEIHSDNPPQRPDVAEAAGQA